VTITAPAGTYLLGQMLTADYSCADAGSGIASCSNAVPSGGIVNTRTVGSQSFTVTATDRVGNSASLAGAYAVVYNICPLYDAGVAKKSGSAYPIKLQLCDAAGANLSTSSVVVHAVGVTHVSSNTPALLDDTGNANPDGDFRYDATANAYVFNLSTKGYATGVYSLMFTAGSDTTVHSVMFAIK